MVGRSREVEDVVGRRSLYFCCLPETRWKRDGARVLEAAGKKYQFYWKGGEEESLGVGVLLAERWIEKVIQVCMFSERVMLVRVLVAKQVINISSAYAPQSGRAMEDKERFWVEMSKVIDRIECQGRLGTMWRSEWACGERVGWV